MNSPRNRTLFLAQRSYRQRRLRDVLRMLPVVSLVLWLLPLLWTSPGEAGTQTGTVGIYVFVVWTVVTLAAAFLASRLRHEPSDDPEPDTEGAP